MIKRGYYSEKQTRFCNVCRYRTIDGREVDITELCDGVSRYDDAVYLGDIDSYIDNFICIVKNNLNFKPSIEPVVTGKFSNYFRKFK